MTFQAPQCPKDKISMTVGFALFQRFKLTCLGGRDTSAPWRLIRCWKCPTCGHSVTMEESPEVKPFAEARPMNGKKRRPITDFAWGVMADLKRGPMPRYEINPGVINRLDAEGALSYFDRRLPSGREVQFVKLSDAGELLLANRGK